MPTEEYPKFFATQVGLAPDKVKQLSEADVEALCAAFRWVTGVDPLRVGAISAEGIWANFKAKRGYAAAD